MCNLYSITKGRATIFTILIAVLVTTSAFAQGQLSNHTAPSTTVDYQRVVRSITGDKTKIKAYCNLAKLYEQLGDAEAKNDMKTVGTLTGKAQAQLDTLGPNYANLLDAFDQTGPDTEEGKKISAALDALDKLCR
jgi:hypothetical protein